MISEDSKVEEKEKKDCKVDEREKTDCNNCKAEE